MTDQDTIDRLRAAMAVEVRGHHLPSGAGREALEAAHRRRHLPALAVAAVLVTVLAVAAAAWLVRPGGGHSPAANGGCTLDRGPLPEWARDGFSPDAIDIQHAVGAQGRIAAIPFVTLRVHQGPDTENKVLWVARDGNFGTLSIRATLGGRTVTRTVPLGPSYLDLPAAGCWSLDLRWPGHHDRVNLRFVP